MNKFCIKKKTISRYFEGKMKYTKIMHKYGGTNGQAAFSPPSK